jgi:hypothetical protein
MGVSLLYEDVKMLMKPSYRKEIDVYVLRAFQHSHTGPKYWVTHRH